MTGEEIIRDVVNTMVNDSWESSRAVIRTVKAEMLGCAMPAHRSPLCQVLFICRFIDDLQHGRLDPRQYGAPATGGPFEFLEDVVLDLEQELMPYAERHIGFERYAGDAPTGGMHEVCPDAFAYLGKNPRGNAGRCSLFTHWLYGTLAVTGLPGLHDENRARWGEDPDWGPFHGNTPAQTGRGRPLPRMGEGTDGFRQHAEFWFAIEQSWDPLPEYGCLLREAVFDAWKTMNRDRRQTWERRHYEAHVDEHYGRYQDLSNAVRLIQAYQRLAMTCVMEHVVKELPVRGVALRRDGTAGAGGVSRDRAGVAVVLFRRGSVFGRPLFR